MIGHFGAADRMNYTAMGDAVNVASRLEGLNKQYGTSIIASDRVFEGARAHFDFRLLDWVAVRGKTGATRIYELLGRKGEGSVTPETVAAYEMAFEAYVARNFAEAIAILAQNPGDPPSAILLKRCREFQKEPPPADWEGIHIAMSK